MAKILTTVALIAVLTFTFLAYADDPTDGASDMGSYWIKMTLTAGPIPGKESFVHPMSWSTTLKISEGYIIYHAQKTDEVVDKDQGTAGNDTTTIIDCYKARVLNIDNLEKTVKVTENISDEDAEALAGTIPVSQFGDVVPNRSFEDALEKFLSGAKFEKSSYEVYDLGVKPIIGFESQGVLIKMITEDDAAAGGSTSGVGGAFASGVAGILDSIGDDDMYFEYWYSEDLGTMVLLKSVMFNGIIEIKIDELETWTPTPEEVRIPEGYEVEIVPAK